MKNPNGYGSVVKLSGNRRRPYMARITTGFNENGHPIYKPLNYYEERTDALMALAQYNSCPYDIDLSKSTFEQIYEKWFDEKFPEKTATNSSSRGCYTAAYKKCSAIYKTKFTEIRKYHMQNVINKCDKGYATKEQIKNLFAQLYSFALENDIVQKDYSKYVKLGEETDVTEKKPFTRAEINMLWDNIEIPYVDTILILMYTGFRISEMLKMENINVDLEEKLLQGGLKTEAGRDRIVPIHSRILDIIKNRYSNEHPYLIQSLRTPTRLGIKPMSKNDYYDIFQPLMERFGMKHTPHDCRHTFITELDNAGANETAIKRLVGHASKDVTEKTYTHKDIDQLRKAIELLK